MVRILLLIVLICLIYWVVTRLLASFKSNQADDNQGSETQTGQNQQDQQSNTKQSDLKKSELKIVQCTRCGLHVPETESHLINDQVICNSSQCNEP